MLHPNINEDVLGGITVSLLAPRYDNPNPIPPLHFDMWRRATSGRLHNAFAAPREHAKSTSITHAMTLALICLRIRDFGLIVSDTEGQASDFLSDIAEEFRENEDLRQTFGFDKLIKDTETRLIGRFNDGHRFRIDAKGTEQKVRGIKWRRRRPNFVIGDDLENDEMVVSSERREKIRKWFMKALLNCGTSETLFIIVGTILHDDSLLNRLVHDPLWNAALYKAHKSLNDFSEILWPEQWPEERLRTKQAHFRGQGDMEGYAQEFLNEPTAEGETYFRKQDFIEQTDEDRAKRKTYYAAADFAITEKEKADATCIMVAGLDSDGVLHIEDIRHGRWDSLRICDELFEVQDANSPEIFTFETEKIDKALGPFLNIRMMKTGKFINIEKMTPTKSKVQRGQSIRARMKAGGVRWNTKMDKYEECYAELMKMTPAGNKGTHDDYFDTFAYIGLTLDKYSEAPSDEEWAEEEYWDEAHNEMDLGRSAVTGY